MASEEPKFSSVNHVGNIEIRNYHPMIIAEASVTGGMEGASGKGFRIIADFIFGNNAGPSGKSEKIDMTIPVVMLRKQKNWSFHFVMPSKYSIQTLPKPNNADVKIKQVDSRRCAVIKFSGTVNEEKFNAKAQALEAWIKSEHLTKIGVPELARYNPPWTLPFLRRNEVIIEIQ